jgi:UDP-GlcNAc:undecaprenyl-phosphate GlcNAc-1-phosphate transferase
MSFVAPVLSLVVTILFLFILRPVAVEVGLLDIPGGRKHHRDRVPLIGGIAMALGLGFGSSLVEAPDFWSPVLLAVYLLIAVGTVDDRYELKPGLRLFAHTCAAMLVVFGAGLAVTHLGTPLFFDLPLGVASSLFSILFIVTLISAFNVIDGVDGLAGGLAVIALAAGALIAASSDALVLLVLLMAVIGGFLLFNLPLPFNRGVHVFMGDAGSTSLGLAIAALGFALTQGEGAPMAPVVGLWLIAVPVFDLFSAVVRRLQARKSVFAPDNHHLHHMLIRQGCTPRATLGVMLGLAALFAGIGLLGHAADLADGWMLIGWLASGVLYHKFMARCALWLRSTGDGVVGSTRP